MMGHWTLTLRKVPGVSCPAWKKEIECGSPPPAGASSVPGNQGQTRLPTTTPPDPASQPVPLAKSVKESNFQTKSLEKCLPVPITVSKVALFFADKKEGHAFLMSPYFLSGTSLIVPSTAPECSLSCAASWRAQPIYLLSAGSSHTCHFLNILLLTRCH